MATYNRANFIKESLISIQNQSFQDWDCIIVDDGGNDDTREVIDPILKVDKRFRFHQRPDENQKGLPGCRNHGLFLSKGTYISFCDDDDIMHPQNLEICVDLFNNPNVDFVNFEKKAFVADLPNIPEVDTIDQSVKFHIGGAELYKVLSNKIPLASCTVMWKKNSLAQQRFNENLQYAEEWEFYSRLLMHGLQGTGIHKVLYYNRKHSASNTGDFWSGDVARTKSKIDACKLVVENLRDRGLFNKNFQRFFVQTSIFLKSKKLLTYILKKPELNNLDRIKFANLYRFYPIISFLMRRKKWLKKSVKKYRVITGYCYSLKHQIE